MTDHNQIADLLLSGIAIQVGTYDSVRSTEPSVYFKTEENAEQVYIKVAEAKLLIAALETAVDYIVKGD